MAYEQKLTADVACNATSSAPPAAPWTASSTSRPSTQVRNDDSHSPPGPHRKALTLAPLIKASAYSVLEPKSPRYSTVSDAVAGERLEGSGSVHFATQPAVRHEQEAVTMLNPGMSGAGDGGGGLGYGGVGQPAQPPQREWPCHSHFALQASVWSAHQLKHGWVPDGNAGDGGGGVKHSGQPSHFSQLHFWAHGWVSRPQSHLQELSIRMHSSHPRHFSCHPHFAYQEFVSEEHQLRHGGGGGEGGSKGGTGGGAGMRTAVTSRAAS